MKRALAHVIEAYFPAMAAEIGEEEEWETATARASGKAGNDGTKKARAYLNDRAKQFARYLVMSDHFLCKNKSPMWAPVSSCLQPFYSMSDEIV